MFISWKMLLSLLTWLNQRGSVSRQKTLLFCSSLPLLPLTILHQLLADHVFQCSQFMSSEGVQDGAGAYKCESERCQGEFGPLWVLYLLFSFFIFPMESTLLSDSNWALGVKVNALDWTAPYRETHGHPPPCSCPAPAYAWVQWERQHRGCKSFLKQRSVSSVKINPLLTVLDKAAMGLSWECLCCKRSVPLWWATCRPNGRSGNRNKEGICFGSALAGRRENEVHKRDCSRLLVHSGKDTELYVLVNEM